MKQKVILIILIFYSAVLAGFLIMEILGEKEIVRDNHLIENSSRKNLIPRRIDGVLVEPEKANLYPIAVMIENKIESRPPSGLAEANLVYEALTEAGITRFLAIYASGEEIKKIGPIRSARPYFLDWAEELKALYLHVGGSPQALGEISHHKIYDLDEYYNSAFFWRDEKRPRPHNVYTSSRLLEKALINKKIPQKGNYQSWLYKDKKDESANFLARKIVIDFSTSPYQVEWFYRPRLADYIRFQEEKPHRDSSGEIIKAKNIICQETETYILDEVGRKKIKTKGEGRALVFQDGKAIEAVWKKEAGSSRTRFYDREGREIKFNRGTTWIEVIPNLELCSF
jgi:hypothetical protein